jgi:CRISPR-associated helicase Cas3
VEAPVGAGKSYILRKVVEDEWFSQRPIILTYPTKILMNAQINALKQEIKSIRHWPDDPEARSDVTLFEYSSDALVRYLRKHPEVTRYDKSEIIYRVLAGHQFVSRRNIIVTTPDVLHLIKEGWYKGAQRIKALLNSSFVFFDEFHLYTNLVNFTPLVQWLVNSIGDKVVFLSATPIIHEDFNSLLREYHSKIIPFSESEGREKDTVFNYPLELDIEECKYTKTEVVVEVLKSLVPSLPKPLAIIFDSIFRLKHLKPILQAEFQDELDIYEYSGMQKDAIDFNNKTVLLGTASIEVGIEMPIKSLITEAAYWTSAVQRIGRVGRMGAGRVVLLTKKRFSPYLKDRTKIKRADLEQDILKKVLNENIGTMVSGEMFRGNSYPFLVIDQRNNFVFPYTEASFAMFEIEDDFVNNWQLLDYDQKFEILKSDYKLKESQIEEILLHDRIFPFWGAIRGKLKNNYDNIKTKLVDNELIIQTGNYRRYYFEGRSMHQ